MLTSSRVPRGTTACVDNVAQQTQLTTETCFLIDTKGNGTGYGQWVHYYTSAYGFTLSAALRKDYWAWNYNNAP